MTVINNKKTNKNKKICKSYKVPVKKCNVKKTETIYTFQYPIERKGTSLEDDMVFPHNIDNSSSFINLDTTNILTEEIEWNPQRNEIEKFLHEFSFFQCNNNIGLVTNTMQFEKWLSVNNFIFQYIHQLYHENKIKVLINEYGLSKSFIRLIAFYKYELCINYIDSDAEIIKHITKQSEECNNIEATLAILREAIGFPSQIVQSIY